MNWYDAPLVARCPDCKDEERKPLAEMHWFECYYYCDEHYEKRVKKE